MNWTKEENIKNSAIWLGRKIQLIEEKDLLLSRQQANKKQGLDTSLRTIYRGGVYWVEFGSGNLGAEKNKTRPAVVISPNHMNKGGTLLVIPLSTKFPRKADQKGYVIPMHKNHFVVYKNKYPLLTQDSAIKCEDIRCVDVVRVRDLIFNIQENDMNKIKKRILYMCGF